MKNLSDYYRSAIEQVKAGCKLAGATPPTTFAFDTVVDPSFDVVDNSVLPIVARVITKITILDQNKNEGQQNA